MESDLKISSEQVQADVPVTVFHLRVWLDAQGEGQLLEQARAAYDGGARYLLIDMSDLHTLTSAGMRALQKVYQIFTPKEDQFKVAHLKPAVQASEGSLRSLLCQRIFQLSQAGAQLSQRLD